ncbi:hypothetical protein B0H34DRAFT_681926 [Crassisporium funariophilum]|nr:hypothetical protein B0H34DRAFT_681926 [Crassisporium funariophilum]
MLARLTTRATRLLDVHFDQTGLSALHFEDEESSLVVDLNALHSLLPPIPENAWHRVAGACGRAIAPMSTSLWNMVSQDLENVAQVLLDSELLHDGVLEDNKPLSLPDKDVHPYRLSHSRPSESSQRNTRRPTDTAATVIVIPCTHPSTPTITIHLAPTQLQETSCRVPCQDQAFGKLLTVPTYPVFNQAHPPMLPRNCPLPSLNSWKWENGHWQAVLPTLREQSQKGLFSRVVTSKRRASRTPSVNMKAPSQAM